MSLLTDLPGEDVSAPILASDQVVIVRGGRTYLGDAAAILADAAGSEVLDQINENLQSTTGLATIASGAYDPNFVVQLLGDGTDESARLQSALNGGRYVYALTAGKTGIVKNIVVAGNRRLDGRGAIFKSAPGARWMFKLTGYYSRLMGCEINDSAGNLPRVSTVATAAAAGATSIKLADASAFEPQMTVAIPVAGEPRHMARIVSVNGNTIAIDRAVTNQAGEAAAVAAGAEVRGGFGAVWVSSGAQRWQVSDISFVGCEQQIVMKPDTPGATGPTRGVVRDIRGDGGYVSNLEIWPNCSETNYYNIRQFGGKTTTTTYTGDGNTTDFAVPTGPVFDKVDMTVRVDGANVSSSLYSYPTTSTVRFATPPSAGATVQLIHTRYGARGLYSDGINSTTTSGGHHFLDCSWLQHEINIDLQQATIHDIVQGYGDGGVFANCRINGLGYSTLNLWSSFGGRYCLHVMGTLVSSLIDGLITELAPTDRRVDGGLGTPVWTESGATLKLNRGRWRGKDIGWGGAGAIEGNQISYSAVPAANTILQITDAIAGNAVVMRALGPSGTSTDVSLRAQNDAQVSLGNVDGRGNNLGFSVTCPTGGAITGRLHAQGAVSGGQAVLTALGSATDIGIRIAAKGAGAITLGSPPQLPSYTKATMPDATLYPRGLVSCSDASGGAAPCYARGSTWINLTTNAALS